MTNEQRRQEIIGLLHERSIFEKRGDTASVELVNEQLRYLGHQAAAPVRRAERRPAAKKETR
jgi:hypothetical protein